MIDVIGCSVEEQLDAAVKGCTEEITVSMQDILDGAGIVEEGATEGEPTSYLARGRKRMRV